VEKVILLVEDDVLVRETVVNLVESLGYRAMSAANGQDALLLVMNEGVDAVLTDVTMPGMNGYQLAERIRAVAPGLPTICVTGYAVAVEDQGHCDVVVRKPYTTATIADALKSVLAASPASVTAR
jgi:CheY-like chemotaxis protein